MSTIRTTGPIAIRSHASLGAALEAADRLAAESRDNCVLTHDGLRWHATPRAEMPGIGRFVAVIRPKLQPRRESWPR